MSPRYHKLLYFARKLRAKHIQLSNILKQLSPLPNFPLLVPYHLCRMPQCLAQCKFLSDNIKLKCCFTMLKNPIALDHVGNKFKCIQRRKASLLKAITTTTLCLTRIEYGKNTQIGFSPYQLWMQIRMRFKSYKTDSLPHIYPPCFQNKMSIILQNSHLVRVFKNLFPKKKPVSFSYTQPGDVCPFAALGSDPPPSCRAVTGQSASIAQIPRKKLCKGLSSCTAVRRKPSELKSRTLTQR